MRIAWMMRSDTEHGEELLMMPTSYWKYTGVSDGTVQFSKKLQIFRKLDNAAQSLVKEWLCYTLN